MRGFYRAGVVAVLFVSAGVLAYGATSPAEDVPLALPRAKVNVLASIGDSDKLAEALSKREAEVAELKRKLADLDDSPLYTRALSTGVVDALKNAKLPEKLKHRLAVAIVREADKNGLDPLLVCAVIHTESAYNSYAVSPVGAMGLMQVMPDTGKYLMETHGEQLGRPNNLFDSELNVELGTAYLADLVQRFGTVEAALVAYNAGPGMAKKILASRASRSKFMQGYPKTVVREWNRLKTAHTDYAQR